MRSEMQEKILIQLSLLNDIPDPVKRAEAKHKLLERAFIIEQWEIMEELQEKNPYLLLGWCGGFIPMVIQGTNW